VTYIRDKRSPVPKSEAVSRVMSANRAKNSKPEVTLRKALWHTGLRGYRCALFQIEFIQARADRGWLA